MFSFEIKLLSSGSFIEIVAPDSPEFFKQLSDRFSLSRDLRHAFNYIPLKSPMDYYYVSSKYGYRKDPKTGQRRFHRGIDLAGTWHEDVLAPADGIVRLAKRHFGFGKMVELQHGRGFYPGQKKTVRYRTRYAHLSKILVKRRQRVSRGDRIGLVGSTGRSTGPHLHYEILINNRRSDPMLTISRFNSEKRLYVR